MTGARDVVFMLTAEPDPALRAKLRNFATDVVGVYKVIEDAEEKTVEKSKLGTNARVEAHLNGARKIAAAAAESVKAGIALDSKEVQEYAKLMAEKERIAAKTQKAISVAMRSADRHGFDDQSKELLRAKIASAAADEIAKIEKRLDILKTAIQQKAAKQAKKLADDEIKEADRVEKREEKKAEREAARMEKLVKDQEKAAERRKKAADKEYDQLFDAAQKSAKKTYDAKIKAEEDAAKRIKAEAEQTARAQAKAAEDYSRVAIAAHNRLADAQTGAVANMVAANSRFGTATREALQSVAELGESVMKTARGFVAIGLVGEKDLDKVKDALLGIQGAFDIMSGSLQTFLKMTRSAEALARAIRAATAAQVALNVAQASGAVTGTAGAAGGVMAGLGGLMSRFRRAPVNMSGQGGMLGMSGGTAAAAGGGAAVAAPAYILPAAIAGGAAFDAYAAQDVGRNMFTYGLGGGAKVGSYTDKVGGSVYNPFSWLFSGGAQRSRVKSDYATTRAQKRSDQLSEMTALQDAEMGRSAGESFGRSAKSLGSKSALFDLAGQRLDDSAGSANSKLEADQQARNAALLKATESLEAKRRAISAQASKARADDEVKAYKDASAQLMALDEKEYKARDAAQQEGGRAQSLAVDVRYKTQEARLAGEIAAEEKRVAEYKAEAAKYDERFKDIREQYLNQAEEGERRIINLLGQRRDIERQTGQEKKQIAEDSLNFAQQEYDIAKAKADSARSQVMSAKERFGMLDSGQQSDLIGLARRAKAGEQLGGEELKRLQGLGLESTNKLVSRQANRLAEQGGFNEIAGEDVQRAKQLQNVQNALAVQVADRRQIVLNYQANTDKIVSDVTKAIGDRLAATDKETADKFAKAFDELNKIRASIRNGGGRG